MKLVKLVFILLTACAVNIKQTYCLRVDTMDTSQTKINLKDPSWAFYASGILKSHSGLYYTTNRNKTLILSAPYGYSIFAAVRLLDLRPNNKDLLTLFANGTAGPVTYSNNHWYQKKTFDVFENKKTFYAPDGQLGVTFYTGPGFEDFDYTGFEIIYTVQANWSRCSFDDFRCSNTRCISKSFKCDGHNHCGDRSDQNNCYFPDPITPGNGRVFGLVAGVVFLLIAVACVIYVIIRRATRMKTQRQTIINQHPPPSNIEGYPPPYSESGLVYPPPPPYSPYPGIVNPGYQ